MSTWKDDDEVTTTYGSIQLSLEQAHAAGVKTEQQRIVALLQERTMKLETEVSDGCGWSFGRHEEIVFITKLIKGEINE